MSLKKMDESYDSDSDEEVALGTKHDEVFIINWQLTLMEQQVPFPSTIEFIKLAYNEFNYDFDNDYDSYHVYLKGRAFYAFSQFRKKFEELDIKTQCNMIKNAQQFISHKVRDIECHVPIEERPKLLCLQTLVKSWLDRDEDEWWKDLSDQCCSISMMQIIKLCFHDIEIPTILLKYSLSIEFNHTDESSRLYKHASIQTYEGKLLWVFSNGYAYTYDPDIYKPRFFVGIVKNYKIDEEDPELGYFKYVPEHYLI